MILGTYVGLDSVLAGKTALLIYEDDGLLAQFDDRSTPGGLAYGWHKFVLSDFAVETSAFETPSKRLTTKITDLIGRKLLKVTEPGDGDLEQDQVRLVFEGGTLVASAISDYGSPTASIYLEVSDETT